MSDYLLTYAAQLDREPRCTCVSTDRGTDTLGCDRHDRCPGGHRWDQHVAHAGCMAMANDWTETAFCACHREPHSAGSGQAAVDWGGRE